MAMNVIIPRMLIVARIRAREFCLIPREEETETTALLPHIAPPQPTANDNSVVMPSNLPIRTLETRQKNADVIPIIRPILPSPSPKSKVRSSPKPKQIIVIGSIFFITQSPPL